MLLAEPEISLLEVLHVLARHRRLIAAAALLAAGLAGIAVFFWPPSYTAEAVILPPQPEQSSQAMMMGSLAGLGNLGGLAGVGAASGFLRNPAELYIGILKSRTVADSLIARFRLAGVYGTSGLTGSRRALERHTSISAGRDSLIRIRVDDHDRARAAQLANAYVDELQRRNSGLALTLASRRRVFFEQQLAGEKNALADAEVALKKVQQASGLVLPEGQSEALIRSIAQLRAEIAGREVQLQGMSAYAAPGNPQLRMVQREVDALRAQLNKLEGGAPDGLAVPARSLPALGLEYVRKLRDVKYHEVLFEILSKQYEAARIDEVRMAPLVQVVDQAVVPDRKSWPPRGLFTLAAGCLGALAACAWVLVKR
ncbi:MAG: Wzz/FepE/Etk N-terminal domain-containing protein [Acidobacteriota bacterium]